MEDFSKKYPGSKHIAVAFRNRFFIIPVNLSPPFDVGALEAKFQWVKRKKNYFKIEIWNKEIKQPKKTFT